MSYAALRQPDSLSMTSQEFAYFLNKHQISDEEAAKRLGTDTATVRGYQQGRFKIPSHVVILLLGNKKPQRRAGHVG